MTAPVTAGGALPPVCREIVAALDLRESIITVSGSASYGGYRHGESDVDLVVWSALPGRHDEIRLPLHRCRVALSANGVARVSICSASLTVAAWEPGFGRLLETHLAVRHRRLGVVCGEGLVDALCDPDPASVGARRLLEFGQILGWLSKHLHQEHDSSSDEEYAKLAVTAMKINGRLKEHEVDTGLARGVLACHHRRHADPQASILEYLADEYAARAREQNR